MGKAIIGGKPARSINKVDQQLQPSPEVVIKEVERIVEVPVEKIVYVDKPVEVIKEVFVDKFIEVEKQPIEVVKYIEKIVEVEKPVQVIKEVRVEVPVEKILERIVEVPLEVVKENETIKKIVPKWAIMVAAVEFAIIVLLIISRS